jgi:hypothetical protein
MLLVEENLWLYRRECKERGSAENSGHHAPPSITVAWPGTRRIGHPEILRVSRTPELMQRTKSGLKVLHITGQCHLE